MTPDHADWDYTPIPRTPIAQPAWRWQVDEYTNYDIRVTPAGLLYFVDDFGRPDGSVRPHDG